MHHYHKLQELLDGHPIGAPPSEEFLEILKILYHEDEAALAVHLDFKLKKASAVAREAGMPRDKVLSRLEDMADRGVLLSKRLDGEPAYALLPNYPGLFEYPVMKGLDSDTQERLARLWHAYYMKHMAAALASAAPPWNRVFPTEAAVPDEYEILPFETASTMMAAAEKVALADCPCRTLARNCERPLDVCLSFDGAARFLADRGMARVVSPEEALHTLEKAEKAGLVHVGSNNAARLIFLCNCCPCCCHLLRLVTEHNFSDALARSSYRAVIESGECSSCGICAEERCPVKAISLDGGPAEVDGGECIGCGLCVTTCSTGAARLVKRAGYKPPPATVSELALQVIAHKQHLKKENK